LTEAKAEKDETLLNYTTLAGSEKTLRAERDSLASTLSNLHSKAETLQAENDRLQSTNDKLAAEAKKHSDSLSEISRKLSVEGGKAALQEKKIKTLQNEVAAANRRAEEAEHAHKGLQNENVGLMASLNEMRPRVMALTEEKLSLTEHIEKLEESRYALEGTISGFEVAAEEARARYETLEAEKLALEARRGGDQDSMALEIERHTQALSQTEEELQSALKSVKELESERAIHRQAVERYQDEMDRLDAELADLRAQYTTLQDEFAISQNAREQDAAILEESHGVVERANAEVEALRNELYSKEEEVEQLKAEVSHSSAKTPRGHQRSSSLDKEMFESDGTFELSAARSKIRTLEATVFQEQAKAHGLRKQVSSLEEELHRLRRMPRSQQVSVIHSPATSNADLPVTTVLDSALPPDVRHKRKISLSMLRARIDGEAALSHASDASPRPPRSRRLSSTLGTMAEETSEAELDEKAPLRADLGPSGSSSIPLRRLERPRPQFLDDSHVFWCSCCRGDLVVL
jgi:chromosome segregation ATPase